MICPGASGSKHEGEHEGWRDVHGSLVTSVSGGREAGDEETGEWVEGGWTAGGGAETFDRRTRERARASCTTSSTPSR